MSEHSRANVSRISVYRKNFHLVQIHKTKNRNICSTELKNVKTLETSRTTLSLPAIRDYQTSLKIIVIQNSQARRRARPIRLHSQIREIGIFP